MRGHELAHVRRGLSGRKGLYVSLSTPGQLKRQTTQNLRQ